jgi:hypothetical protein
MTFRLQKFNTVYPAFAKQFLDHIPDVERLPYAEIYERLVSSAFGQSNFFSKHLCSLGHEAEDCHASIEPLQKAWAREHSATYEESSWLHEIVLAQIGHFHPDVVYLQDLYLFDSAFRNRLRSIHRPPRLIVGWRAAPTSDFSAFGDLDLVFTAHPGFVEDFRRNGVTAVFMPLAFEHTLLQAINIDSARDLDFTFVGSLGNSLGGHSQRHAIMEQLMQLTPLEVWGDTLISLSPMKKAACSTIYHANQVLRRIGSSEGWRRRCPLIGRGAAWRSNPSAPSIRDRYPDRYHPPVFGLQNLEILARTKIAFNSHIDMAQDYCGNVRMYEATGVGACLLTDWKDNLPELFEPDVEVVTYRSGDECVEKTRYLLAHDSERRAIAAAGHRRTLRDHTYFQRIKTMAGILDRLLGDD